MSAEVVEQIVQALEVHQRVGTLTDACLCGAGDIDTLQESGLATTRHWRHLARVIARLV